VNNRQGDERPSEAGMRRKSRCQRRSASRRWHEPRLARFIRWLPCFVAGELSTIFRCFTAFGCDSRELEPTVVATILFKMSAKCISFGFGLDACLVSIIVLCPSRTRGRGRGRFSVGFCGERRTAFDGLLFFFFEDSCRRSISFAKRGPWNKGQVKSRCWSQSL
jgi:hypothetical protein